MCVDRGFGSILSCCFQVCLGGLFFRSACSSVARGVCFAKLFPAVVAFCESVRRLLFSARCFHVVFYRVLRVESGFAFFALKVTLWVFRNTFHVSSEACFALTDPVTLSARCQGFFGWDGVSRARFLKNEITTTSLLLCQVFYPLNYSLPPCLSIGC